MQAHGPLERQRGQATSNPTPCAGKLADVRLLCGSQGCPAAMQVMQVFYLEAGSLCIAQSEMIGCWSWKYVKKKPKYERRMQPECSPKHAGACLPEKVCHNVGDSASSLRQGLHTRDRRSLSSCDNTRSNTCKAKSSAQVARGEYLNSIHM